MTDEHRQHAAKKERQELTVGLERRGDNSTLRVSVTGTGFFIGGDGSIFG